MKLQKNFIKFLYFIQLEFQKRNLGQMLVQYLHEILYI